ncbi:hypothetical protein DUI87_31210 [Hirundo rustica rustica]|uniref:RNase H type-1 domain-containing protein n=1 Tax=Hirundo rustica rustica TaxID=333673 RepID=A0A3M0JCB5_HIRRU|nr:hypothetical protein DUI87_31210 [Hirundo rustica rustica]
MDKMLKEHISPAGGKPSPCPDKGESDGAAAEPTDVTTVQVPAEPQGQPQPAAVAPVETKKYKVKSEHPESLVTFVEQLTRAIELQVKNEGAQEQVLEEMALANANERCKAAILSLSIEPAPPLHYMLQVEEQQVPIATSMVYRRQYRTNRDALIPIHEMIRELETQGVVSKTHSPFNSPIWPVRKPDGEWRLTVDYRALNEVSPPLSAAVPDMLELQYELESKAAKCPTICHGLIQAALEKGEVLGHLQYIDDIIVWENTAVEVFEKGEKIIQILLEAGFAIKKTKSQIVSPLYLVTRKKNDFHWGPEQQQAFAQIKQEIAHAVALGPVRTGPEVKNVLYSAAGNNGLSWSLWQKVPGETRGRPLGFWSRSYRGSEVNYTPTEKEILAAYEGVQAASEVIGTEAQLLLAPRLPVLGWMFKGKVPSTHHATDATWSKWIALITQRARIGNPNCPGILEIITNWPEGENFGLMDEEEQQQVTRAKEGPPYNQLPAEETRYALFTDGSCRIVRMNRKGKAAIQSPTRQVAQATEGEGGSSQLAELKAVQLALDIAEREKWPKLCLYTDLWMVANALWGWLHRWKKTNWQCRGETILPSSHPPGSR